MAKDKKLKSERYGGRTIQFFKTNEGIKAYIEGKYFVGKAPTKTEALALALAKEAIRRMGYYKGHWPSKYIP